MRAGDTKLLLHGKLVDAGNKKILADFKNSSMSAQLIVRFEVVGQCGFSSTCN